MNQKFGGARKPTGTGTPLLPWSCVIIVVSLLAGASVVHNIYKPDLRLPLVEVDNDQRTELKQQEKA